MKDTVVRRLDAQNAGMETLRVAEFQFALALMKASSASTARVHLHPRFSETKIATPPRSLRSLHSYRGTQGILPRLQFGAPPGLVLGLRYRSYLSGNWLELLLDGCVSIVGIALARVAEAHRQVFAPMKSAGTGTSVHRERRFIADGGFVRTSTVRWHQPLDSVDRSLLLLRLRQGWLW
jgi:hypothetical protein